MDIPPDTPILVSSVEGVDPIRATVLYTFAGRCDDCGLAVYRCRTECGMEGTFCRSLLRWPN